MRAGSKAPGDGDSDRVGLGAGTGQEQGQRPAGAAGRGVANAVIVNVRKMTGLAMAKPTDTFCVRKGMSGGSHLGSPLIPVTLGGELVCGVQLCLLQALHPSESGFSQLVT